MNLLIDTHALIWWAENSRRLGRQARELIAAPENSIWVSVVSVWEMSIKSSLDRLDVSGILSARMEEDLVRFGFRDLPITVRHALMIRHLPLHHRDPFDRMLIAQAKCEDLTVLTADPAFNGYEVRTIDARS